MGTSLLLSLILVQDPVSLQEVCTIDIPPNLNVTHSSRTSSALYLLDRRSPVPAQVTDYNSKRRCVDHRRRLSGRTYQRNSDDHVLTRTRLTGVDGGGVVAVGHDGSAWAFVANSEVGEGRLYCARDLTAESFERLELAFAPGRRPASTVAEGRMYLRLDLTEKVLR